MKIAIAHYWLVSLRGGEKVLKSLLKIYPDADIYTLFADPELVKRHFPKNKVITSPFNTPFFRRYYQFLFPLYPLFVWSLRLRGSYDLLLSSESGPCKGIHKPKQTRHVCYMHTPMRYAWGYTHEYLRVLPPFARPIAHFFFTLLRYWDKTTVANVDQYICNSKNVQERVQRFYQRSSKVVYPPIADSIFNQFNSAQAIRAKSGRNYFLCFGALVPYKRIDLAIQAFNRNGLPLRVYGTGSEFQRLKSIAGPNIELCGTLLDDDFTSTIAQARALLFPGEEDFGMIPVEVMALGTPVIAFKGGGALETVVESSTAEQSTGLFFEEQTETSLAHAVERFIAQESSYREDFIHQHAMQFSEQVFIKRMRTVLDI